MDLQAYLSETNTSPACFAQTINVSVQSLYRYLRFQRLPQPDVLERIAHATDGRVQPNDFYAFARQQDAA